MVTRNDTKKQSQSSIFATHPQRPIRMLIRRSQRNVNIYANRGKKLVSSMNGCFITDVDKKDCQAQ